MDICIHDVAEHRPEHRNAHHRGVHAVAALPQHDPAFAGWKAMLGAVMVESRGLTRGLQVRVYREPLR
eukprot:4867654-Lingulodinium_polyedra.AAC.1